MSRLGESLLAAGQDTGVATPDREKPCHEFLNDHSARRGEDEHLMAAFYKIFTLVTMKAEEEARYDHFNY